MTLSCFKRAPSNFLRDLTPISFNEEARLFSDVEGSLILSSDDPLAFRAEICIYLKQVFEQVTEINIYRLVETLISFECYYFQNDFLPRK